MKAQFIILAMALLLVLPMISAGELTTIDNIKDTTYLGESIGGYPEITLKNSLLWIIPLDPITDIKLSSHTFDCITDCNSEQTFNSYYPTKIEDVRFIDNKGKEVDLQYSLYYWGEETYIDTEIDYDKSEQICKESENKTQVCSWNYAYKDVERTRIAKIPYTLGEELTGDKEIGIEHIIGIDAKKSPNQNIDYQFKVNGKWIDELAWWDANWNYKKQIDFTGTIPSNYSTRLKVKWNSNMQSDWSDIRFLDGTETTELGMWIEFSNATESAIWVGQLHNNNSIYMYYGKSGVNNASDIKKAFVVGDAFNESSLDSAKWGCSGLYCAIVSGGLITQGQQHSGVSEKIYSTQNMSGEILFTPTIVSYSGGVMLSRDVNDGVPAAAYATYISNDDAEYIERDAGGAWAEGSGSNYRGVGTELALVQFTRFGNKLNQTSYNPNTDRIVNGTYSTTLTGIAGGYGGFYNGVADRNSTIRWMHFSSYIEPIPTFTFGTEEAGELRAMTVTQSYPANATQTNSNLINFSCNFTGNVYNNISSVRINVYDTGNNVDYTNTDTGSYGVSYNKTWLNVNLNNDTYKWDCGGFGNAGTNATSGNRTLLIHTSIPQIVFYSPVGNQGIKTLPYNVTLNYTASDEKLQSCWYNNSWNSTITYQANCNTTAIISVPNGGTNNVCIFANDTFGNTNSSCSIFYPSAIYGSVIFNQTSYETSYEGFSVIINATSELTNPYFSYGGTNYTAASSNSGLNYSFSRQITAPLVDSTTNKSFYFGWFQGVNHYSLEMSNQTIYRINLALCNETYNSSVFLNISFKDEDSLASIRASIPTSTFNYYIDDSTIYRTLTYINNTANDNFAFCFSPSHKSIRTSAYVQYKNDTNYPQRIWNPTTLNLTNITTNQVLYLLSSTDGLYTTFRVTSSLGIALSGVEVTATRVVGSSTETIGTGTTDAAGLFTIWVNPDFSHTFTFSKTGYDTYIYITNPTQSSYDIVLGRSGEIGQVTDYTKGIVINIQPISPYLYNATTYNFNYTISSNNWSLDSYGYILRYGNNSIASIQSGSTSTGGYLASNVNVGNQTRMVMDYYYVVNSTYINGTKIWIVEVPNDFSIKYLFTRVGTYVDANLLGIKGEDGQDLFGKALLSVLVLIIVTGTLTYRYGIVSEAAILGVIFGVVLFLNSINFIPNPSFLTGSVELGEVLIYLIGALTIGFIFKEESR